jgi:hypothetical protein
VALVGNVRVISRVVALNPFGPDQSQAPPLTGCGPNLTDAPEATVAELVFCQAPPLI